MNFLIDNRFGMSLWRRLVLIFLLVPPNSGGAADSTRSAALQAQEGATVSLYADESLANNIYSMTLNPSGRVVVSGPGYIKTLFDDDRDGRAERAELFSELPKSGAQGMCFDGADLLVSGDEGILRFTDANEDGRADGPPQVLVRLGHSEHGAHGIIRGPDGFFYVACGDQAGVIDSVRLPPSSPVQKPEAGCILRMSGDGSLVEVLAHGFRNPYDLAFHPLGYLLTVDSDSERDYLLPWYRPMRGYDVFTGGHHGWFGRPGGSRQWNLPDYYFDTVPAIFESGRGSPTGVVYEADDSGRGDGSLFFACWSLGRIYEAKLTRHESSPGNRVKMEVFLEAEGHDGFSPVDIAIGPERLFYVACGGRGTRGAVYQVKRTVSRVANEDDLTKVLNAEQPFEAWSRSQWEPIAKRLGPKPFERFVYTDGAAAVGYSRAVETLVHPLGAMNVELANSIQFTAAQAPGDVRTARAIWGLSSQRTSSTVDDRIPLFETASRKSDSARAAWEALCRAAPSGDGRLRSAGWNRSLHRFGQPDWRQSILTIRKGWRPTSIDDRSENRFPSADLVFTPWFAERLSPNRRTSAWSDLLFVTQALAELLQDENRGEIASRHVQLLSLLRMAIISAGDLERDVGMEASDSAVVAGYAFTGGKTNESYSRIGESLQELFPSTDSRLDFELARLISALGVTGKVKFLKELANSTKAAESPSDAMHYLIVSSRFAGERDPETTSAIANVLLSFDERFRSKKLSPSRNWPEVYRRTVRSLLRVDTTLAQELATSSKLDDPLDGLAVLELRQPEQVEAARTLLRQARERDASVLENPLLCEVAAFLPRDEARAWLLQAIEHDGAAETAIRLLAKIAVAEDSPVLIRGLNSLDPSVVSSCAQSLTEMRLMDPSIVSAATGALRKSFHDKGMSPAKVAVSRLLESYLELPSTEGANQLNREWEGWLNLIGQRFPEVAANFAQVSTANGAVWKERIESLTWSTGDSERGREVFQRRQCARCHAGSTPIGPDLAGLTRRLSRADVVRSIVEPSAEVAPQYQLAEITTHAGKTDMAIVLYESPEVTLTQNAQGETSRFLQGEIASIAKTGQSLMPTGLLDNASDQEIVDLVAFLSSELGNRGR